MEIETKIVDVCGGVCYSAVVLGIPDKINILCEWLGVSAGVGASNRKVQIQNTQGLTLSEEILCFVIRKVTYIRNSYR